MGKMGFPARWLRWIQNCVSSPTFQILINGEPTKPFTASNGIHKGDPIAPYLFVIAMQGLSAMMEVAVDAKLISPLKAGRLRISHIIFVDDLIIFAEATPTNTDYVKAIMNCFSLFFVLNMNGAKSHLICSKSADGDKLSKLVGASVLSLPTTYPGLPLYAERLSKIHCQPLLDKMAKRLDSWKSHVLSMARRIELVISTLSSFSIY